MDNAVFVLPVTDKLLTETGSSYLACLSIATNLVELRLRLILHTFLQPFNYNFFILLNSFGIQSNSEKLDLPYIYWIPKMHKNPYKHRFIAGSSKCSTKPLSILLTKLLTHIKQGLQKYCETAYSRSGINQMWILRNSKELIDHLKSPNFNLITNIKSFDFSTLYTAIPHQKLKSRLATIIRNSFLHKNENRRYKYLVLGREGPYFVKEHSDLKNKYTEEDIIKMLEFLVDNIFVVFAGKVPWAVPLS